MTIADELQAELEDAMRAKDRARLDVIRQVRTEASIRASAPGFFGEVDDDLYQEVISSYVKKMSKARAEYEALGEAGAEMAEKLAFEVSYLDRWLPQMQDEEETRALVRGAISELGVEDPKQAGRVIGHLMKAHPGELDGGLVNRLVREELAGE
ncbi:MAG: GatB/YqeY domain-containing protein [Acidimicrobiia bacterium]